MGIKTQITFLNLKKINIIYKNFLINTYVLDNKYKIPTPFDSISESTALILPLGGWSKLEYNLNKTVILHLKNKKINTVNLLKKKIKWIAKKFTYRGKGFKVKKFNKLSKLTFRLGKSHWTKVLYKKTRINIKRTKKNTYVWLTLNKINVKNLDKLIKDIKGINIYTKRGLRLSRQIVKKRFGKVSQASSIYK